MKKISTFLLMLMISTGVFTACKDEDPPLPDNTVQFEASEQGFGSDKNELEVKLKLARNVDVASALTIELQASDVTYGSEFTTTPAAVNNVITLSIPAGSNTASFKITKAENIFLSGDESIKFTVKSAGSGVVIGKTATFDLKFSSIVSEGTKLTLNGLAGNEAGSSAGNSVFVDLSNNSQSPVLRKSWDLGFFAGNDFRVIINNTSSALVKVLDKNDLTKVTETDTIGVNLSLNQVSPNPEEFLMLDSYTGDITKTVIPAVSANDADNKVIILNRGTGGAIAARPWYKIRVLRNGNGYTLQYARITETTFKTLYVTKDALYNFNFVSLETGATPVEPKKNDWDIQWTYSVYKTSFGAGDVPYNFSDLVAINHLGGVKVAEVLTSTVTYDAYAEATIATTTFVSDKWAIGSGWRSTSPSGASLKADRFYVIKDTAGNVYKLKFISFHPNDGGTRGKPVIEYKLVKKA